MLWQAEHIKLPNNFRQAKAHLLCLERRLEKTPEFKALYSETIKADLVKGYVRNLSLEKKSPLLIRNSGTFLTIPCKIHINLINLGVFAMLRVGSVERL